MSSISRSVLSWLIVCSAVVLILPIFWGCPNGGGELLPNIPPITRLSNVPPPDSFIISKNPRLSLSWVGDDPDGYVVAFKYRWNFRLDASSPFQYKPWSTILNVSNVTGGGVSRTDNFAMMTDADEQTVLDVYKYFTTLPPEGLNPDSAVILETGETLRIAGANVWASNPRSAAFPVHTNPNSGTFIFDSQDSLNPHTFEVSAIDNTGVIGRAATVSFGTPRVIPPSTEVTGSPGDTVLVRDKTTDTFSGVQFTFRGYDPNSRTLDYSWVVDKDVWPRDGVPWSPFSPSPTANVTATDLPDPYASKHTFYVRSRNEFGSIDTLGYFVRALYDNNNNLTGRFDTVYARKTFFTVYPPFLRPGYAQRILVIDNSFDYGANSTAPHPSRVVLNNYYSALLDSVGKAGRYDIADVVDAVRPVRTFFPGRGMVGRYSVIIFVGDVVNVVAFNGVKNTWGHLFGGKRQAIIEDYVNIGGKFIVSAWNFPLPQNGGEDFTAKVLHTQDNRQDTSKGDFGGAYGQKDYPDALLDTSKIDTTVWGSGLRYLWVGRPRGFGEIIYRYQARNNNPIVQFLFNNAPIGVRYLGVTYDVVYYAFPLYYIQQSSAIAILRKGLDDINELNR